MTAPILRPIWHGVDDEPLQRHAVEPLAIQLPLARMPAAIVKKGYFPHRSVVTDRFVYATNAQSRIVSRAAHLPTPWHPLKQLLLDTLPLIRWPLQPV